jgi:hypothetical protein
MRFHRRWLVALSAAGALVAACEAPSQSAHSPEHPTARNAEVCRRVEHFADPLIVDWRPEQRAELEALMQEGVVVVSYDCNVLRVLKDCKLQGTYGFAGMAPKEQVIQLRNEDEVRANMPASADALVKELAASAQKGVGLDVGLATIGRRATSRATAHRPELKGQCDGASHFVRRAVVGAFAMQGGTDPKPPAAAELFAARASGGGLRASEGDLAACRSASPDATSAPAACSSIVRLELSAIDAPVGATSELQSPKCPKGLVRAQQKCMLPMPYLDYECAFDDSPTCAQECNKGNMVSCGRLGWSYANGYSVAKDEARAFDNLKRSCDAGYEEACAALGTMYAKGSQPAGSDPEKARTLFEQACSAGVARGCHFLGIVHREGVGVSKDPERAFVYFLRSCDQGQASGCAAAGDLVHTKDKKRAISLYRRACVGDNVEGCKALERLGGK